MSFCSINDIKRRSQARRIDFGAINVAQLPLIVEQDKSLAKGGLWWAAAFVLGEYLIETSNSTL